MTSHPPESPEPVARPAMLNDWLDLTFIHWPYEISAVRALLPAGLEVEPFDGRAWVGLVPFRMVVSHPRVPPIPWLTQFNETNVRTYVKGPNGEVGVYFFSLEAARLGAVLTGRALYGVPYFWAKMSHSTDGQQHSYVSRRRWPDGGPASAVTVRVGSVIAPQQVTPFDHYLTARWALFGVRRGQLTFARAAHPRWALHNADLLECDDDLVAAAGLPGAKSDPVVHWSPGVSVRIGKPTQLA